MTTPLFDYSNDRNLARIADALEAQSKVHSCIQWQLHAIILHLTGARAALTAFLMASEPTVTPAAAAPADFDGAQYADAFDAKMGNPLAALGNLSPFAELTRNEPIGIALNDAQVGEELRVKLTFRGTAAAPAADPGDEDDRDDGKPRIRVFWSKYDPRSRELARLRTAANHRAIAAKTPETRDAALVESAVYHNESQSRHGRLRRWLAEGKIAIDSDNLYRVAADGTKSKWVPSSTLTLPE